MAGAGNQLRPMMRTLPHPKPGAEPANSGAVAVVGVCCGSTGRCERFWSLWAPSAAKLELTAAVVITVITVLTVTMGIPPFDRKEEGRTKRGVLPQKTDSKRASFRRRQISRAKSFGMK